ncbi:uncharacterized protein FYW61_019594 [Anableps anableps]
MEVPYAALDFKQKPDVKNTQKKTEEEPVYSRSDSETAQPGGSVTLNCTVQTGGCSGEHRVYWFRNSAKYDPGLTYTHGGRDDQCVRSPTTQTHTCLYKLPVKNINKSHVGTYYCAVASCGRIVFGNGTKLELETKVDSVYLLRGALVFTTFLSVLQAVLLFMLCKRNHPKDPGPSITTAEGDQNEENLHYAALRTKRLSDQKSSRLGRQRNKKADCVYSSIQL